MLSRFERFIYDLTEIDLYWHRIASVEMKNYGLKGNYAIYFVKLFRHPEGLTSAQLAVECGKDKADVSRDMNALEKAGFIVRQNNGTSSYRALINLSENGRNLTAIIIKKAEAAVDFIGKDLSDEQREVFYSALDSITSNIQQLSEEHLPLSTQ